MPDPGAYLLATCVAIPASGYAVNRFSARTVWLLSLATFLVASMLCGLAWSTASVIFFRVIQGLSGGLIGMVATIVLTRAAGPDRAGRAFSMIAVPVLVGARRQRRRQAQAAGPTSARARSR